METVREIEVVLGDLHIGHPDSRWKRAVECLARLNERHSIFAFYFAGDTIELAYAHEFGGPDALQRESDLFFQSLRKHNLAERCVFLVGNHDSSLEVLPSTSEFVVAEYAWLFCQTFRVLILHGHGLGYERVVSAFGRSAEALRQLRRHLESVQPATLPRLTGTDWLVTGHFDIPVRDQTEKVVGLGSWVGDLARNDRGYYAIICPTAVDAPLVLRKYMG